MNMPVTAAAEAERSCRGLRLALIFWFSGVMLVFLLATVGAIRLLDAVRMENKTLREATLDRANQHQPRPHAGDGRAGQTTAGPLRGPVHAGKRDGPAGDAAASGAGCHPARGLLTRAVCADWQSARRLATVGNLPHYRG